MSLLLDENLSPHLLQRLSSLFPGMILVRDVGLKQASEIIRGWASLPSDKGFRVSRGNVQVAPEHFGVRQDLTVVSSANFRLARDPLSYEAITRYSALPSLKLFRISVKPARRKRSINSST